MSQFGQASLPYMNLVWFGVDKEDNILAFFTLGDGNVPEFVTAGFEETERLYNYFYAGTQPSEYPIFSFRNRHSREHLAKQGLYIYEINGETPEEYRRIHEPATPLKLGDLPEEIRVLMLSHRLDLAARTDEIVSTPDTDRL